MNVSVSSRLIGLATTAVLLTAGVDYWSAIHNVRSQQSQQASRILERFARTGGYDMSRMKGDLEIVAPGSMLTILDGSSQRDGSIANGASSRPLSRSFLRCLSTPGIACVHGDLVAVKILRPPNVTQLAILLLTYPWGTGLAAPIWGTGIAVCFFLALIMHWVNAISFSKPLKAMEHSISELVSTRFHPISVDVPGHAWSSLLPIKQFLAESPELNQLMSTLDQLTTANLTFRQKVFDQEKQHLVWLAYLSHDLAAPLGRVLARLQALEYEPELSSEQRRRLLDSAHMEVDQLAEVIASISQFATLESNIERSFVETSLPTLLEHAIDVFEFEACKKSVELDLRVDGGLDFVQIEKSLMRRAIENLISNAIRFTPEGGLISVRAEQSDNTVHITVSDSGLGISAEDLPRIFEFAFRGEQQSRPGCFGSQGLGLALVKRVAELHHGEVIARTLETNGAELVISIPVAKHASSAERKS